ncbi:MAG: envelope biogenesis factor ElyC [Campylobacterota bacterium]
MFFLKKALGSLLMPFPLFLVLFGIGLFLWHRGYLKWSKRVILASLVWITLLSYAPFSSLLIAPLEERHPRLNPTALEGVRYIHVLGSGHVSNPDIPLSSQLGTASLVRINEGVALYKSRPGMKLIFSGFGYTDAVSNARKNAEMAMVLGVPSSDIVLLETPKDTAEEAMAAKSIVGGQPLVLVTSASHMPRAVALFSKAGVNVLPAPTDFQVKKRNDVWEFPSAEGLQRSESAFHEYLGLAWGKLRGLI